MQAVRLRAPARTIGASPAAPRALTCAPPRTHVAAAFLLLCFAPACNHRPERPVTGAFEPPRRLSELGIVSIEGGRVVPAAGAIPIQLNSELFADYASAYRHVKLPPGAVMRWHPTGTLQFPVGTLLAKTIAYPRDKRVAGGPERAIETQLLVLEEQGWRPLPYVWNAEQTDASLKVAGGVVEVSWIHADGAQRTNQHLVPNANQCKNCHQQGATTLPLGLGVENLNLSLAGAPEENQLARLARMGVVAGLPKRPEALPRLAAWDRPASGSLAERARSYLEVNCAHCHNTLGAARNSNLDLRSANHDQLTRGILKTPVSAGRGAGPYRYDIVPGKPEESILVYRLKSVDPGVVMPEFGKRLVHEEGVELISAWIRSMPPQEAPAGGWLGTVEELRPGALAAYVVDVMAHGDALRGTRVFQLESLNCKKCHAVRGVGGNVGPDLARMGPQATPAHVLESLLFPNKTIREGYRAVTVQTVDGQAITGVQVADRVDDLVLRDPVRGETTIAKSSIAERTEGASLMPTDLAASLDRQQFLDLVRFIVELNRSAEIGSADRGPDAPDATHASGRH